MSKEESLYTFDRVVRLVLSTATIVAVIALMRYLSGVLLPFAAAVVLAYLLNPLVNVFERKTKRRRVAVALTLGTLGLACLALIFMLVPLIAYQIGEFKDGVVKLRADLAFSGDYAVDNEAQGATPPEIDGKQGGTALGWTELKRAWTRYRQDAPRKTRSARFAQLRADLAGTYYGEGLERAIRYAKSDEFNQLMVGLARRIVEGGWTVVTFTVDIVLGLTGLIVVLLYVVFLLLDYPAYSRRWPAFLPPRYRDPIVEFYDRFSVAMRRYFRGQAVVALLVGALFCIGFTLIGLPMAIPLGLFVGLLNMVPYLQTVGLVPGFFLAGLRAIEGDSSFLLSIVLVLMIFAIVQTIQDTLITPRIMGKATGLRPVSILLGVFIWGKLLGFLGLLLAIPLTCLGIAYYQRYVLQDSPDST